MTKVTYDIEHKIGCVTLKLSKNFPGGAIHLSPIMNGEKDEPALFTLFAAGQGGLRRNLEAAPTPTFSLEYKMQTTVIVG